MSTNDENKPARNTNGESESDGLPELNRFPGEPPARFPYDREVVCDVLAWHQASPNFYFGPDEVAYSRERYTVVLDPSMRDVPHGQRVRVQLREDADPEPQADPEDTDEVLQEYLRWRTRHRRLGNGRAYLEGSPRPGPVLGLSTAGNYHRPYLADTPLGVPYRHKYGRRL